MRSLRTIILPTPGDPFLFKYWWRYFRPCLDERYVDRLIIIVNSTLPRSVQMYIETLTYSYDAVEVEYFDHYIDHGRAIEAGLAHVTNSDDYVGLLEDDCIVLKPKAIGDCFDFLKNGAVLVGSPRNSCSNEIMDVAAQRFGVLKAPRGEEGVNFWPNLFFASRSLYDYVPEDCFGGKVWQPGEAIWPLGHIAQATCSSDTFVEASLYIREHYKQNSFGHLMLVNQGHLNQIDHLLKPRQQGIWGWSDPGWVHIGSLSTCLTTLLIDMFGYSLAGTKRSLEDIPNKEASLDIYKQAAFWCWLFYYDAAMENDFAGQTQEMREFSARYFYAVEQLCTFLGVERDWLQERSRMYYELGL